MHAHPTRVATASRRNPATPDLWRGRGSCAIPSRREPRGSGGPKLRSSRAVQASGGSPGRCSPPAQPLNGGGLPQTRSRRRTDGT